MPRFVRDEDKIAMWLLGVATGVFLMIIDELINLSLYCGARCQYPIPLIGPLGIWDAWSLIFILLIITMLTTLLLVTARSESIGDRQRAL
jgi:hypothetical protein